MATHLAQASKCSEIQVATNLLTVLVLAGTDGLAGAKDPNARHYYIQNRQRLGRVLPHSVLNLELWSSELDAVTGDRPAGAGPAVDPDAKEIISKMNAASKMFACCGQCVLEMLFQALQAFKVTTGVQRLQHRCPRRCLFQFNIW